MVSGHLHIVGILCTHYLNKSFCSQLVMMRKLIDEIYGSEAAPEIEAKIGELIEKYNHHDRHVNLTHQDVVLVQKLVRWYFQVQRSRSLANTATDVIVRSVAGTKPTTKVSGVWHRDAS